MNQEKRGVLILEDPAHPELEGKVFTGMLFGAENFATTQSPDSRDRGYGEVVFNTSMTGYQEILTDPSYYGEIVCMTAPHIGNTGVNDEDLESAHPWCAGLVVHETCDIPSHWRSQGNLDQYLKRYGIPALKGVDTRALTLHLRQTGVVRGLILPESEKHLARELLQTLPAFEGRDMISEVSTKQAYVYRGLTLKPKFKVVALDFGMKTNQLRALDHLGCEIEVVPAKASAEEILAKRPHGVFLSNGPGDPSAAPYAAQTVKKLIGKVPIMGVCMGHQILALALGAKTYKLKFGHRGGNQPVLDCAHKKVEISSHNHGYSVDGSSLPTNAEVTHINLNDKTVEGLQVKGANAFSVQYHPEASPGPHDSLEIFQRFVNAMERTQN